jgi:hypothetical protein
MDSQCLKLLFGNVALAEPATVEGLRAAFPIPSRRLPQPAHPDMLVVRSPEDRLALFQAVKLMTFERLDQCGGLRVAHGFGNLRHRGIPEITA